MADVADGVRSKALSAVFNWELLQGSTHFSAMDFLTSGSRCKKQSHRHWVADFSGTITNRCLTQGATASWACAQTPAWDFWFHLKQKVEFRLNLRAKLVVVSTFWGKKMESLRGVKTYRSFKSEQTSQLVFLYPVLTSFHGIETVMATACMLSQVSCCYSIAKEKLSYWSSSNLLSRWLYLL